MAIVSSNAGSSKGAPRPKPSRVVDAVRQPDDSAELSTTKEDGLRPRRLDDYIGQRELKQVLGIAIQAAMGRGEALDHVLLYLSLIHI